MLVEPEENGWKATTLSKSLDIGGGKNKVVSMQRSTDLGEAVQLSLEATLKEENRVEEENV